MAVRPRARHSDDRLTSIGPGYPPQCFGYRTTLSSGPAFPATGAGYAIGVRPAAASGPAGSPFGHGGATVTSATQVNRVVLEPEAAELVAATANPPFLFQLPPEQGRQQVEDLQSGQGVPKPEISEEWIQVQGGPTGVIPVRIVKPAGGRTLPGILFIHGAGWVFGSARTHDRLVRELATRADAAVVFPEFDHSPEAKYPTAIEQCYAVGQWMVRHGAEMGIDPSRMAIAGDSAGGNMAIAVTLLAKQRGDLRFTGQALFYPVTDANFDTGSYRQFGEGYYLQRDGMIWFWDNYTSDPAQRSEITASPLRASVDQLAGLPPALLINGEADVLCEEGQAYGNKLRAAGVPVTAVRFQGMVHDFMMLDSLRDTRANRAALDLAGDFLHTALAR